MSDLEYGTPPLPQENAVGIPSAETLNPADISLIESLLDESIAPEAYAELAKRLADDAAFRSRFVEIVRCHAALCWDSETLFGDLREESPANGPASPDFGGVRFPEVFHSVRDRIAGYCDEHPMTFSYIVASAIFLVIGVVASHIYITSHSSPSVAAVQNRQAAADVAEAASEKKDWEKPLPSMANARRARFVGRVTGEVDCRWTCKTRNGGDEEARRHTNLTAQSPSLPLSQSPSYVCFGDKLFVASGLLEITYDSGAKVVLEGPCTFNVEMNGGFLKVGRLTGRLEKKPVASGQWSVASQASGERKLPVYDANVQVRSKQGADAPRSPLQSPISNSQSPFVIATPTAIVTDLGTEFGVEVDRNGASEVHVIRGLVDAKFLDAGGRVFRSVDLKQGEARHYDQKAKQVATIAVDHKKFAEMQIEAAKQRRLQRWAAFRHELQKDAALVAYYPMASSDGDSPILRNVSATGSDMDGKIVGARWANGRLSGKASLWFHDAGDHVALPHPERFKFDKAFSVAVWFQIKRFCKEPEHALIAKGDVGWRILQRTDAAGVTFDTNSGRNGDIGRFYPTFGANWLADAEWHHAVAVFQADRRVGHKYFYIDGQLDIKGDIPLPLAQNDKPVWIGNNSQHGDLAFDGWIDEVAIFSRAISKDEVAAIYANDVNAWLKRKSVQPSEIVIRKK